MSHAPLPVNDVLEHQTDNIILGHPLVSALIFHDHPLTPPGLCWDTVLFEYRHALRQSAALLWCLGSVWAANSVVGHHYPVNFAPLGCPLARSPTREAWNRAEILSIDASHRTFQYVGQFQLRDSQHDLVD